MFKLWTESHDAFAKIYERFRSPLFHFVKSRVSDPEVAEELTQEVFLKAYRFRDSYRECYALSTWLWTIARNTVSDHLRGSRSDSSGTATGTEADELACGRPCAESMAIRKQERRDLLKMLRSLTRLQKRVIWMRVIHQLSYEEISRNLGVSLSAVKNLAYRARMSLTGDFGMIAGLTL